MLSTATLPDALRRVDSPIGRILLTGDGEAVTGLSMQRAGALPLDDAPEQSDDVLDAAAAQLTEYFAGRRRSFDVPVRLVGTDFQRAVWDYLATIPYGEIVSYGAIGLATGRPTAGRAVGGAVGANPVPLLVPCHRVLGISRRITGYSGGDGIPTKAWLLAHEGIEHRA
ncbi:methylated-DNA-[protein]-cysteine S-methyltransferase [Diaminobutyricimonas aerilata]|uniref:Methylated-DNA--protein-cysteine methyltransferase n=1 Tax=Diaminobutyricimonas aerilata TaxID=1162967 RepID=A0A2M9CLH3_9MICO|nr:methylated-DNA--[protein]-cysteine S-methyltransferase [Diaminobutyricimonas aerilata]PJJ72720.1 methylated-DNA-[protein]-cysteine S-methyltransferase [Diaminobutyricimonas aerilata]